MATDATALTRRIVFATWLVLVAASLAAVVTRWSGSLLLAAWLLLPLALPLPGIARGDRRTHAWATLCTVPGFVYGITESIANPAARGPAAAVLAASLVFFFALVAHLRASRPQAPAGG
ncbi:MAG: DUF2069 domain-containing protein [Steroidobacteraceae bacterium]